MVLPSMSQMVTQTHVKMAVHSTLQKVPMLRRLLVKVGMIWPMLECPTGSVGRSIAAVADEVWHCPVAVPMVMVGAAWLRSMMGMEDMKQCPLVPVSAIAVQLHGMVDMRRGFQTSEADSKNNGMF